MAVKPLWSVTGGIGIISQQGVFSAARYIGEERTGTIIATVAQVDETGKLWQAITEIKIEPSVPQRIALMPGFARLSAGEQQYFYVALMDAYDNEIPADVNKFTWNVSSNIGSIKNAGPDQQQLLFPLSKGGQGDVIHNIFYCLYNQSNIIS